MKKLTVNRSHQQAKDLLRKKKSIYRLRRQKQEQMSPKERLLLREKCRERKEKIYIIRLFAAAGNSLRDKYFEYLSIMMIQSGLSLDECLALTIEDVEKKDFLILYPDIDPFLLEWFKKQARVRNCPYILYLRTRQTYDYYFAKLRLKAGLEEDVHRLLPMLKS